MKKRNKKRKVVFVNHIVTIHIEKEGKSNREFLYFILSIVIGIVIEIIF
jgi:hypothetical protein